MDWIDRPWAAALVAAALLCGCTAMSPRKSPLPNDGPTMTDIYRHHVATEGASSARDRLPLRPADDHLEVGQRRARSHPLDNRFERLSNPDLTMHVFPHLAQGRYPVPGYDTVFPMYETIHYALPGEVPPMQRRVGSTPPRPLASLPREAAAPAPRDRTVSIPIAR
ncbi:MAG TPA: TIGR03751 family conjugal transfer lipoprotein [Aquabacterium sp.]|nr:TIGR03751 family conjugal transfer lipoprotein [Aquabacterium sp.]